jgi:hypothetical protein
MSAKAICSFVQFNSEVSLLIFFFFSLYDLFIAESGILKASLLLYVALSLYIQFF